MSRGRPYEWPDPKDRSPNNPQVLVPAEQVRSLYNQETDQKAKNVSETVRTQFEKYAKDAGWEEVEWASNTAVLKKQWCKE